MKFAPEKYTKRCPVCSLPAWIDCQGGSYDIDCACCGSFRLTDMAAALLPGKLNTGREVALASWFLRQNEGFIISLETISFLENVHPLSVAKRGIELLFVLALMFPDPGNFIPHTLLQVNPIFLRTRNVPRNDIYSGGNMTSKLLDPLKLLAISASQNEQELNWLVQVYLQELGYLRQKTDGYEITIDGWKAIEASDCS